MALLRSVDVTRLTEGLPFRPPYFVAMDFIHEDYNDAGTFFARDGSGEWSEIAEILDRLPPHFHGSLQAGKSGSAIFDPKGTNQFLTTELGWPKIPVPAALVQAALGVDWDAGKRSTLAEWQFSNYPFLLNNVVRTDAVFQCRVPLAGMESVGGLVVVTRRHVLPASNSVLYYEQAKAQLDFIKDLGTFAVPVRLVGLGIPDGASTVDGIWTQYGGRTSRTVVTSTAEQFEIEWGRESKYGPRSARFRLA